MTEESKILNGALPPEQGQPTIGIITALPEEYVAVKIWLEKPIAYEVPGKGAGRQYLLGELPAAGSGKHFVVLAEAAGMGNNLAAVQTAQLLAHFPNSDKPKPNRACL